MPNTITSVRGHLTAALAGLGVPVANEYAAMPTPPQIVLRLSRYAPATLDAATVEVDVACIAPLAGAGAAVEQLDQLVCDAAAALDAAGVQTFDVTGYTSDTDTGTLSAFIPTATVWKD